MATFTCYSKFTPTFFKKRREEDFMRITTEKTLTLRNLKQKDSGIYVCIGNRKEGRFSNDSYLYVVGMLFFLAVKPKL